MTADFKFEFEKQPRESIISDESRQNTRFIICLFFAGILSIILLPPLVKSLASFLLALYPSNAVFLFLTVYPGITWFIGFVLCFYSVWLAYNRPTNEYLTTKMTDAEIEAEKARWLRELRTKAEEFAKAHSAKIVFSSSIEKEKAFVDVVFGFNYINPENSDLSYDCKQEYKFEY